MAQGSTLASRTLDIPELATNSESLQVLVACTGACTCVCPCVYMCVHVCVRVHLSVSISLCLRSDLRNYSQPS